jgi:hypothetical protein
VELLGFDGNEVGPLSLEDIKSYLSSIKEKKRKYENLYY